MLFVKLETQIITSFGGIDTFCLNVDTSVWMWLYLQKLSVWEFTKIRV